MAHTKAWIRRAVFKSRSRVGSDARWPGEWAYGIDVSAEDATRIVGPIRFSGWAVLLAATLPGTACNWNANLGTIGDGSASLLWKSTFEVGNLSEWTGDGQGFPFTSNLALVPSVTSTMAHHGTHSAAVPVAPLMGTMSVNYLARQQPSPPAAYYSAWFFVPSNIGVPIGSYLSLFHFRGSNTSDGTQPYPLWDVNLYPTGTGSLAAQMYDFKQDDTQQTPPAVPFPTDKWVQLEVFLAKAVPTDAGVPHGRITIWQNGTQILDRENIATVMNDYLQLDVGAASNAINPDPISIYMDDVAISLVQLGPNSTL
jgi:hypothetical protein